MKFLANCLGPSNSLRWVLVADLNHLLPICTPKSWNSWTFAWNDVSQVPTRVIQHVFLRGDASSWSLATRPSAHPSFVDFAGASDVVPPQRKVTSWAIPSIKQSLFVFVARFTKSIHLSLSSPFKGRSLCCIHIYIYKKPMATHCSLTILTNQLWANYGKYHLWL